MKKKFNNFDDRKNISERIHPKRRLSKLKLLSFMGVIILFATVASTLLYITQSVEQQEDSAKRQRLEDAIQRATVNCYVVEGFYPSDINYIEDHYGIQIDHDTYAVLYECIGSNVKPEVKVVPLENGGNYD